MDGGQQPSYAELAALVVQLQATVACLMKRIDDLETENARLATENAKLAAENAELRKNSYLFTVPQVKSGAGAVSQRSSLIPSKGSR
jgi:regulator of replication initiation timing